MNRKLPSRAKQAHLQHTRLARRALGLAALLGLAAAPVAAQAGTTTVPEDFDLVAALPVVAPGTLWADHQFTQAVAGFLNDDSIPDVAVIADGVVHVLLNPGFWSAHVALPGTDVRDLALVRRVSTQGDGLLTASASGATLWRWKASPTPVFTPYPVGGEWSDLRLVASEPSAWSTQLIVLLLLDADSSTLHSRVMVPDTDPALPPVLFEVFDPLPLPYPPLAIALFQWQPVGYPQVAVADATGLSLWSLDGLPLPSWPVSVTSSFLCPLERDASTGVARRLAWVRHAVGVAAQRVVVIDLQQGNEPATNLGNAFTGAVATGSTTDSYGGPEYVEDEDLVLRRLDGTALVLQNECGLPEGQYGGATTFKTECLLAPSQTAAVPWDAQGRPVIADFDADGWDDLVTWDDAEGTALVGRRGLPPANPPNFLQLQMEIEDWTSPTGTPPPPSVRLFPCALQSDTTRVDVIVWRSASDNAAQIELDPVSIGYRSFDPATEPPCGPEPEGWTVPLALAAGERPPFIGVELRALNASGRTTQVQSQLMTRECYVYDYLYCELEVLPPYQPPSEACTGPPTCPTSLPVGDYIAGLLPVPRLPSFEGNQLPMIIVQ